MKRALLALIRFYRRRVSPLKPPCCRFIPTCSQYALEAIERYGAARGGWLALKRLSRCHPLHFGAHEFLDPVPDLSPRLRPQKRVSYPLRRNKDA